MKHFTHSVLLGLALLWHLPGFSADCIFPGSFTLVESGTGPYTYTFTVDLDTVPGNDTKAIEIIFMLSDGTMDTVCFPPPLVNPIVHSVTSPNSGLSGSLEYTSWTANNGVCQGGSCSGGIVMPINVRSLSATVVSGRVMLRWISENTVDDQRYVVERSTDLRRFHNIGSIEVHDRSAGTHPFSFIDDTPPFGEVYYRIREYSLDGAETSTGIVPVYVDAPIASSVYPNPIADRLYLRVDREVPDSEVLFFTNAEGKEFSLSYGEMRSQGYIDMSGLTPGMWILSSRSLGSFKIVKL